ncbi:MAG: ribonuclease P protein component [Patescibacteria group bacterium]|jgi:ribonuclease P protein component|nr:ribonuclease P protein component [Patescibacteria group bacterium]
MFASKNRLSKQKDFDNIFKNGKTIKSGFFKIIFFENRFKINRYSIIVNKKVSKNAITRNKIKRIVRKQIKEYTFNNNNKDIVFIVYPNFLEKTKESTNEIKKALSKIDIYRFFV